jgi:release factor glutamine methyltransferase
VEYALELLPAGSEARVADLGTGCGAIALAIASERPTARITATDISGSALDIARGNASRLQIGNVDFMESDWFAALDGEFDMVVSNPPYISSADGHLQRGDLRFEPELALASGPEGLDAIRSIISGCSGMLSAKGHILLEHGFEQATAVRALLAESGFTGIRTLQDIESRDRLTTAQSGD